MSDDSKIIIPEELKGSLEVENRRKKERRKEDRNSVPVVIKRIDEAIRHPDDILERAIEEGVRQHKRSKLSLVLSAVSAGLILGFAGMSVALATQATIDIDNPFLRRFIVSLVYPLGFIVCIMSGTQLFTEQTATALYPVLDRNIKVKSLIRIWILILFGNLIGAFLSSLLLTQADLVIVAGEGYSAIYHHFISVDNLSLFVSAVLAGWLMAQGGWLTLATPPASSQIICIYIVTFIIGIGGLHHSIAGATEVFSGLLNSPNPHYGTGLFKLSIAVLGNLVGGTVFVGLLNYAHIRKAQ